MIHAIESWWSQDPGTLSQTALMNEHPRRWDDLIYPEESQNNDLKDYHGAQNDSEIGVKHQHNTMLSKSAMLN